MSLSGGESELNSCSSVESKVDHMSKKTGLVAVRITVQ